MRVSGVRVIIMCKAPLAGHVKTRLTPHYSADEAAALHRAMATTVIQRAKRLFEDVVIAADDVSHPFFTGLSLPILAQGEGHLGERMNRQLAAAFAAGVKAVLLLGTDSPHMPDSRLIAAVEALNHADVVLGPVEDGGYDLVAMNRLLSIFDGVVWSSGQVLEQTVQNITMQGLSVEQLHTSFDVDFPADVDRAKRCGWIPGCQ